MNVRILARPTIQWALLALFLASGTYFALLFTLAQYLQLGLGRSPLISGLTLVPWVAAFGIAGQLVGRLMSIGLAASDVDRGSKCEHDSELTHTEGS